MNSHISPVPDGEQAHPVFDLTLADHDGNPRRLSDFAGRPLIVQVLRYYG